MDGGDPDIDVAGTAAYVDGPYADQGTFHLVDLTTPQQEPTAETDSTPRWALALVAVLALAVGAIGATMLSSDAPPDASPENAAPPAVATPVEEDIPPRATAAISAPAIGSAAAAATSDLSYQLSWAEGGSVWFAAPRSTESVAADRVSISVGALIQSGPVAFGNDAVVAAAGNALAISPSGGTRNLGDADLVLPSGRADAVWLGAIVTETTTQDVSPLLASPPGRVRWTEIDTDGNVLRAATREPNLDFGTPALVWGFQSTIYRLSDRTRHPWRFISPGYPVAVGPNDVILNVCSSNRTTCDRRWFDARSGESAGPLLDMVANNFMPHHGGQISPDGRWAVTETTNAGLQIHALATGETIDHACRSTAQMAWAPTGLLACHGLLGVTVYDLATGRFETTADIPSDATIALHDLSS